MHPKPQYPFDEEDILQDEINAKREQFWDGLASFPTKTMREHIADEPAALSMILCCIAKDGDVKSLIENICKIEQ